MDIPIYILNNNNEVRKERMKKRFQNDVIFNEGVNIDEKEYKISKDTVRVWNIMLSHLENIRQFYYNTDAQFAILCEDDIYVHKDLDPILPNVIKDFQNLDLDIMLLSYLLPFHPRHSCSHILTNNNFEYYDYDNDMWGAHMYLISRAYAIYVLEKFTLDWAQQHQDEPYSPDWILTKKGKKALIWPPLGVEEGEVKTDDQGQIDFHRKCSRFLYDKEIYI